MRAWIQLKQVTCRNMETPFLESGTRATIFFTVVRLLFKGGYYSRAVTIRGRLLFEGGIYFIGKPADINDWIRYVRVRR